MWPLSTVGYSISDISSSWYSSSRAAELTGFYYERQSNTNKLPSPVAAAKRGLPTFTAVQYASMSYQVETEREDACEPTTKLS